MPSTNHAVLDLPEQAITIAATFTAEPIEDFLDFFMGELDLPARIQFAPFNQVLQQLLDPSSELARNCHGFNVLLVRLEDLDQSSDQPQAYPRIGLPGHAEELADAIDTFVGRTALPLLVLICPPSGAVAQDAKRQALNQEVEARLALRLGQSPGVSIVTSVALTERFPRLSYYAPGADAEGGVPYTPRFFAGLARHLVRRIAALGTIPRKVILLDADGTLWKGICGEDGWASVEIGNAQRALQTFMLRKHDEGMLLCVCSKNNQADVWAVFDNHPDMVLRREHITAWRVNWDRKSENIRSLADALALGMDSFILIDDSALERAEVEAHCPGVLTVRLPDDSRLVPSFLENFWAFDRTRVTDTDSARTELYRQNARREDLRSASAGLRSFLRGLDLQIDVAAMAPPDVRRVAQLMQRTTQFNIRRIARSEAEVNALLRTEHTECLVVDVRDRFGAYGLVGVLVAEIRPNTVCLDTFLLSCRALGRGVEHRMLAAIGARATQRGIPFVEVPVMKTSRNKPAVEFLERVASRFRIGSGDQVVYRLPAEVAAEISIDDYVDAVERGDPIPVTLVESANGNARGPDLDEAPRLHHIATALDDDDKVLAAVERYRQRGRPETLPVPLAPRSSVEIELAKLWTQVLGVHEVGADDDFFDLGGHSILAMELISRVGDTFGVELPLRGVFETPTLAGLAAAIMARVDPSREPDYAAYGLPAVSPDPEHRGEPFPLSDIQQAYWVGRDAGFELGNVAAHFYTEVEYVDLDIGRFNAAWRHLIQRHGMLRAVIRPDGRQQILDSVPEYHIEVLDLRANEPAMAAATLGSMRNRLSHEVRETDRWPLFEICAARVDARRVRVYYSFDLLIADAFSLLLLTREVLAQYNNPSAALERPDLSFRDYVLAEAALVGSEPHRRSVEYWRRRLPELPPPPELALCKPLAAVRHPRFVRHEVRLEPQRWQRLRRRAEQAGLTPTVVVLCAFADVIAAWSKSSRFTLNLTLLNRMPVHEQVNRVVGDFTGVELLGIDTSLGDTFEKRAARVQQQLWEDLDHRHIGGVHLMRELARAQEAHGAALMPVVFTSTLNLGGADVDSLPFAEGGTPVFGVTQTPQVCLDCGVFQHAGSLLVTWDVVEELFPEGMLVDVFSTFGAILDGLADNESAWTRTRRVPLPAWQRQQRDIINTTAGPEPGELLHSPFLAQAARQPEAPAVITSARTLSYHEVYQRSLDLAHELRRSGAQPNELVAVVMEKGWEQVVAVQAILQAGAAYLPIDPDLPRERLWYLLEHGEVRLAVTQARVDDRLLWPDGLQRLHVEGDVLPRHLEPLEPIQASGDLAYVIFTSGSTGVPKGVMIDHRGALNTLLDLNERFCVGPEDRVFAFSSLSFDLSVYDIFGTLAAGGAIVMPDAAGLRDPAHWSELLHRGRVTLWNSVPALMQMLVDFAADRPGALAESLRMVWLSGDWIPISLPDRIKVLRPGVRVISMGGATEASIWSIMYPIERVERAWKSIPYGKPLRNQTFHVLDAALQPRPVWVPGELYIGGVGVAKGYWRDEVKTRAKFIVHAETGERLYRTGDLGRFLPDGNIEFLGREDFQVKIQGFRLELGEIEAVLAQHPDVRESVVVAQDGVTAGAGKRLLAYVVLVDGATSAQGSLRDFLAAKLPAYMVPAEWMILPSLPLTSNGKVDRRALPSPEGSRVELQQTYAAPRDQLESELAEIWMQALGVRPIGISDNFFDLGGHSLLAALIFGEITAKYGRELPLTTLFEGPTIAELAVILRAQPRQVPWSPVVAIQTKGSRPPFFCLHSAGGNVLEYYPLATRLGPDQPFYALQAQGLDGGPTGPERLEDMAAQYLAAIRTVQPSGAYHLGGFCLGGLLALEVAQQLRAAGEDVALVVMIETPTGGYGRALPHTTALERLAHRARQRVELEFGNLAPLEPRARMAHGLKRVRRLLTLGWTNLEKAADPLVALAVPDRHHSHARLLNALTAAHGRAYDNYVPRRYPGRVVLFRASEQPWGIIPDPTMGWDGLIPIESQIFEVPGRHKNILAEPHVKLLAERLQACLEPAANQRAVRPLASAAVG